MAFTFGVGKLVHSPSSVATALNRLRPYLPMIGVLLMLASAGGYAALYAKGSVFVGGFIAILVFYAVIFLVGSYAARLRKSDTPDEIMLAGRALPLGLAVFSMSATWIDGGYINGTAEYTAAEGLLWVQAPWGYAISLMLGGLFFARRMRRMRFRTMLDPFAQRFGERVAALLFIPALLGEIFWTAAILAALGSTFSTVLGVDYSTAVVLSGITAITYISIGGIWAVALTDTVQLALLFIGLWMIGLVLLHQYGGAGEVWSAYAAKVGEAAQPLPRQSVLGERTMLWWDGAFLLILGGIPWQAYFQRVLSSRSEGVAVRLSVFAGLICLITAIPAALVGMIGLITPESEWIAYGAAGKPESWAMVFPAVVRWLCPPILAVIAIGAVAAAVMSSMDASILSASSMSAWNVWRPLLRPTATSRQLTRVIRLSVWGVGSLAMLVALQVKSVYALWFLCSDLVYCLLFPALVVALFYPRANRAGVVSGFVVALLLRIGGGEATFGLAPFLPYPVADSGVMLFPFKTFAMLCGLLTMLLVSSITMNRYPPIPLKRLADEQP